MFLSGLLLESGPYQRSRSTAVSRRFSTISPPISVARGRKHAVARSELAFRLWSTSGAMTGSETVSKAGAWGRFQWCSVSRA